MASIPLSHERKKRISLPHERQIWSCLRELTDHAAPKLELRDRAGFRAWWRELVEWPPDVFAVTSVLLLESGAYRFVVSPPGNGAWEPHRTFEDDAEKWRDWLTNEPRGPLPTMLRQVEDLIDAHFDTAVRSLGDEPAAGLASCRPLIEKLLCLHGMADALSVGAGVPYRAMISNAAALRDAIPIQNFRSEIKLTLTGTLSRFHPDQLLVLPKLRTPQRGLTIRSISHNLCVSRSEVRVNWSVSASWTGDQVQDGLLPPEEVEKHRVDPTRMNLVLIPWPFEIQASSFEEEVPCWMTHIAGSGVGAFAFRPRAEHVRRHVVAALDAAYAKFEHVHGVVLPECAVTDEEFDDIQSILDRYGIGLLLAGVRSIKKETVNVARLGLKMAGEGGGWTRYDQHKHHRWMLDERQILAYKLGTSISPWKKYFENIRIPPRELNFVSLNDWMCLTHLVCEDLAQLDPVSGVIRSVGPNLLIALLLDGPQLEARWPGRYASVLADDPGTSVLTFSSLGMVQRSVPPGKEPSRVVALWKDARTGTHQVALEPGANGIVLSLVACGTTEYTADGRHDHGLAFTIGLAGTEQLRWSIDNVQEPNVAPAQLVDDDQKLAVLCFLADALVYVPSEYKALVSTAREQIDSIPSARDWLRAETDEVLRLFESIDGQLGADRTDDEWRKELEHTMARVLSTDLRRALIWALQGQRSARRMHKTHL